MEDNNDDQNDFRKTKVSVIKTTFNFNVEKALKKKLVNRVEGKILTPDEIEKHTPDEISTSKN